MPRRKPDFDDLNENYPRDPVDDLVSPGTLSMSRRQAIGCGSALLILVSSSLSLLSECISRERTTSLSTERPNPSSSPSSNGSPASIAPTSIPSLAESPRTFITPAAINSPAAAPRIAVSPSPTPISPEIRIRDVALNSALLKKPNTPIPDEILEEYKWLYQNAQGYIGSIINPRNLKVRPPALHAFLPQTADFSLREFSYPNQAISSFRPGGVSFEPGTTRYGWVPLLANPLFRHAEILRRERIIGHRDRDSGINLVNTYTLVMEYPNQDPDLTRPRSTLRAKTQIETVTIFNEILLASGGDPSVINNMRPEEMRLEAERVFPKMPSFMQRGILVYHASSILSQIETDPEHPSWDFETVKSSEGSGDVVLWGTNKRILDDGTSIDLFAPRDGSLFFRSYFS